MITLMDTAWKEMEAWIELQNMSDNPVHSHGNGIHVSGRSPRPVQIRYYQSPSAFRRSGALTPRTLSFSYRLSPYMGCEQCDINKNPFCFENYNPWWKSGEIKVKTNTKSLLRETLDNDTGCGDILMDGFDNIQTEKTTGLLRDCLLILSEYPNRINIQASRPDLLIDYLPELKILGKKLTIWVSIAEDLSFKQDIVLDLAESGIKVVLNVLLFPYINSDDMALSDIRHFAAKHCLKIEYNWLRVTNRGPQRAAVLAWLGNKYGREMAEKYKRLYPSDRPSGKYGKIPCFPKMSD